MEEYDATPGPEVPPTEIPQPEAAQTEAARPRAPGRIRSSHVVAAGVAVGMAMAGLGVAAAQEVATPDGSGPAGEPGARQAETPLTGETADKVEAAALAAVPGATVDKVETDSDGAPYEAHITRADGTRATVKVAEDFSVTVVEDGRGPGGGTHRGRGPGGGPGHEARTPLTAETADKVEAAALAAVPGATVDRVQGDPGGTYHAHVTRSDGTRAVVKVGQDFSVTSVDDDPAPRS